MYIRILIAAVVLAAAQNAGATSPSFGEYWHDGKAELDGYRLTVSRYGEERAGTCVMVYVTEPFSESKNVKVDDPQRDPADTFDALKLNIVRDFQTGIYDYNTMVSVFVRSSNFAPAKISFTSAEWCGHVYEELVFGAEGINGYYYSYFEDESGPRALDNAPQGVAEDNLFVLLRGLRGDYLEPGESREVRLLPSVYFGRLAHKKPEWTSAEISRSPETERIQVPAGDFSTMVYNVRVADGRTGTFHIEAEYPHRIVRWHMLPDVKGELTGSARLEYWRLNGNGDESYLEKLGLK